MNLLLLEKRTSLSRPNSVIISCYMFSIFLEAQQVLISSWRHKEHWRQRDSSTTNGLITRTKCRVENFPRMMPSTVNFAAETPSKPNTLITLTFQKVDWPQNKPLSNWNCQNHPYWNWETSILATDMEARTKELFQEFLRWYNNKDVVPILEAMQKLIAF